MSSIQPEKLKREDEVLDSTLRPGSWQDYVGQDKIKENIKIIITAAKQRGGQIQAEARDGEGRYEIR